MKKKKNKDSICKVTNCGKSAFCKGYCTKHYQQIKHNGKIKEEICLIIPELCKNLGCGRKIFAKGVCQKCYRKERKSK